MILSKGNGFLWILIIALCIVERSAAASRDGEAGSATGSAPLAMGLYDDGGRRDPLDPLDRPKSVAAVVSGLMGVKSVDDLQIEGLVLDPPDGSFVMVNGVILREGEGQSGVKALQIQPDGVSFDIQGTVTFKAYDPAAGLSADGSLS